MRPALHAFTRRAALVALAAVAAPPRAALGSTTVERFTEQKLGLVLGSAAGGGVQVERTEVGSPAWERGVRPLVKLLAVNEQPTQGLTLKQVRELVLRADRPVRLLLDGSMYDGLAPAEVVEKAAAAQGMDTARVGVRRLGPGGGEAVEITAPPSCFASRESDVVEIEYTGRLASSGVIFDSTAGRGGGVEKPFALMLGNNDVVSGLELGLFEMCIGEEREVRVPAQLGFGARGSKTFGVPPGEDLVYRVKLVSIAGQTDPRTRRADLDDEQRF